jgi:hypothetical protein
MENLVYVKPEIVSHRAITFETLVSGGSGFNDKEDKGKNKGNKNDDDKSKGRGGDKGKGKGDKGKR